MLKGKNALIVGASSGIGLASARQLLAAGANVTIAARNADKLAAAAQCLQAEAGPAAGAVGWIRCDGCDEAEVKAAVDRAARSDGRLDIAVAVAGGGGGGPVALMDTAVFEKTVAEGPLPVFLMIKHATPLMKKAGGGSIVAISSISSVLPGAFLGAYGAGKAALEVLVRVAADELGAFGIRVNGIRPGFTRTDSTQQLLELPGYVEGYLGEQALKRIGEAADIAAAVRFFAGPESAWITGQLLNVDGGVSLHRIPRRNPNILQGAIPESWKDFLG